MALDETVSGLHCTFCREYLHFECQTPYKGLLDESLGDTDFGVGWEVLPFTMVEDIGS